MRTITNKPVLDIKELNFSRSNTKIFKNLNLQINAGEHIALLGSNGSGKSTLFELIIGTLTPESGSINTHGNRIAFVPQRSEFNDLLPMTVKDTVEMGRWAGKGIFKRLKASDHKIVDKQLERLKISDLANKQLSKLSGGQKQRALIAQALAQEAPLLMLDEPEAGLDSDAAKIINQVLTEEAKKGVAVIIATHDLGSAKNAKRSILLTRQAQGIAVDGKPSDIEKHQNAPRNFL